MDIYIVYSMLAFELDILHQFNRYFIYDLNIGFNNRLNREALFKTISRKQSNIWIL